MSKTMTVKNVMPGEPRTTIEEPLQALHTIEGYRRYFIDADYWRPHLERVCARHRLTTRPRLRTGLAGSFPTFIVDDRWVIKFFGRLFEGGLAFETERQLNQLITASGQIPAPALLDVGRLFPASKDWSWPYLIFEFVPGVSIGEVYAQVGFEDKLQVARWMGQITQTLHQLPPDSLSPPLREAYHALIRAQYRRCAAIHRAAGVVPEAILRQIDAYLPPLDDLLDPARASLLIHADLTKDHLLGRLAAGRWRSHYLIDFGDAMVGDLAYELVALHLDLFDGDKRLLAAYLEAYGLDAATRRALPKRAMALTLLHRFEVLEAIYEHFPAVRAATRLEDLTGLLWDLGD